MKSNLARLSACCLSNFSSIKLPEFNGLEGKTSIIPLRWKQNMSVGIKSWDNTVVITETNWTTTRGDGQTKQFTSSIKWPDGRWKNKFAEIIWDNQGSRKPEIPSEDKSSGENCNCLHRVDIYWLEIFEKLNCARVLGCHTIKVYSQLFDSPDIWFT